MWKRQRKSLPCRWLYRGCIKKTQPQEFPKKSTLQFLSVKDFRPLGIEIEC